MYFITVLSLVTKIHEGREFKNQVQSRCMGYFYTLNEAVERIEKNILDIHECSYKYAVIEKYSDGLYPHPEEIQWFEWKDGYERCLKPEPLKNVVCFGIG